MAETVAERLRRRSDARLARQGVEAAEARMTARMAEDHLAQPSGDLIPASDLRRLMRAPVKRPRRTR